MKEAVITGEFLLRKYPGKGGWTYLSLPKPEKFGKKPFGFNRVSGTIDQYAFKDLSIWNTKNGDLFFPVKAEIRKAIGKEAGETVRISLYADAAIPSGAEALQQLLKEDREAGRAFKKLPAGKRRELEFWVGQAQTEDEQLKRLAKLLDLLAKP